MVGLAILSMGTMTSCGGKYSSFRESQVIMGTVVQITVAHPDEGIARKALESAFEEIRRAEKLLSSYLPESEVSAVNLRAAREAVPVSEEVLEIIDRALEASRSSGGAFDVTVGPLMEQWNFDSGGTVPAENDLEAALALVGFERLSLDREKGTVRFLAEGMKIDLGGIGKGYAVDRAAAALLEAGITNAIIDAGGDLRLLGHRPGKDFWRVGIRHPRDPGRLLLSLDLADRAVVTSGDYERFFMSGERRYHHLLDPATGFPATGCESVTVIAAAAADADAYATAAFILGPEKGLDFLRDLPDVEGIIVDSAGDLLWTDREALGQ